MKKLIVSALLIFIVCVAAAQSKQEKTVAATVEKLRMAMIDANKTELEKLVAEKLSYGHSSGKVEDKNSFVSNIINGNFFL